MSEFIASMNSSDPNIPTSSGQHILIKDQTKIKKAARQTTIVVNSRDRNYNNYPNPNHFRYSLRRPLTNVLSIELINATIPSLLFTIEPTWGSFTFSEETTKYNITLTPGYYTDSTIMVELQRQLNAISTKVNTYSVTQDPRHLSIIINATNGSPVDFSLLFSSGDFKDDINPNTLALLSINTPARLLGFGLNDYKSSAGKITSPLPIDLENFFNRLYLHLETDGKSLARMEMGAGRQDCFHIFNIEPGIYHYTSLNKDTIQSMFISSPAPIARISNLNVDIRDEFNRPAYLNYREVQLIFEITHLE